MFADVVGCSEISNHEGIKEYYDFIDIFQNCFRTVCESYQKKVYEVHEHDFFDFKARGDEGCLKIYLPRRRDDELATDIDVAISIALELKKRWFFTEYNERRILNGLLPIDLAIGIHSGKVYVKHGQPEGYSINLAKRIESAARRGNFTHILLSESAHGQLCHLKEEFTYKFDQPFSIKPKGISHAIQAFEIKHHFLPTDWTDVISEEPEEVSMIYPELSQTKILQIAKKAYDINPTNLWLAEENVILSMMDAYQLLCKENKTENLKAKVKKYTPALEMAQRITNSVLRDATTLSTLGLILGELDKLEEEEDKYREGIKLDESDGDIHWYLGLCLSYQLLKEQQKSQKLNEFYEEHKEKIQEVLKEYKRAIDLRPKNPWMLYDYSCELSWWSQVNKSYREKAIKKLIVALDYNNDIKDWAIEEAYLKPIIDDLKIKKSL